MSRFLSFSQTKLNGDNATTKRAAKRMFEKRWYWSDDVDY